MKLLAKNILSVTISEGGSRILGFFTTIYIANLLSIDGYGLINIGLAVFSYALIFSSQWFNVYGTRAVASGNYRNFLSNFVSLRIILSILIFIIITFFSFIFIQDHNFRLLVILFTLSIIPNALVLDCFFQGKENLLPQSVGKLVISGLYFLLLVLFLNISSSLDIIPISFLVANIVAMFVMLIWYYKIYGKINISVDSKYWWKIFKESFTISYSSILAQFNSNIPIIVIAVVLTAADAGIYSAASKLVLFLLILDRLFYSIYFPAITRIFNKTGEKLPEIIGFVFKFTIIFLLPFTITIGMFADSIINITFGDKYFEAVNLLQILIWYFFITILNSIFGYGLIAVNQEKYYAKIILLNSVAFILILVPFTYYFGLTGTVLAIVASELLILILFRYYFGLFIKVKLLNNILKTIPALIIMLAIMFFTSIEFIAINVIAGLMAYTVVLIITGGITKSDIFYLKEKFLWN